MAQQLGHSFCSSSAFFHALEGRNVISFGWRFRHKSLQTKLKTNMVFILGFTFVDEGSLQLKYVTNGLNGEFDFSCPY